MLELFNFFVSIIQLLIIISITGFCLNLHERKKGSKLITSNSQDNDAYIKKKPAKPAKKRKTKIKKEGSGKGKKKYSRFFLFPFKDEDLKTAKSEELLANSTQLTNSDVQDHSSPLEAYVFSDLEEVEENLGNLKLVPSPDQKKLEKLRMRAKRKRYGDYKSPDDYSYPDEEDSLYNVPSLQVDLNTITSSKSGFPIDVKDSRMLIAPSTQKPGRVHAVRSHFVYAAKDAEQTVKQEGKSLLINVP